MFCYDLSSLWYYDIILILYHNIAHPKLKSMCLHALSCVWLDFLWSAHILRLHFFRSKATQFDFYFVLVMKLIWMKERAMLQTCGRGLREECRIRGPKNIRHVQLIKDRWPVRALSLPLSHKHTYTRTHTHLSNSSPGFVEGPMVHRASFHMMKQPAAARERRRGNISHLQRRGKAHKLGIGVQICLEMRDERVGEEMTRGGEEWRGWLLWHKR